MRLLVTAITFFINSSLVFSQTNFLDHTSYDKANYNEPRVSKITNQPLSGVYQDFYPNGQLRAELNYVNGYLFGESKYYYDSGQLSYLVDYRPRILKKKLYNEDAEFIGVIEDSLFYSLPYLEEYDLDGESLGLSTRFIENHSFEICYDKNGVEVDCDSYFSIQRPVLLGIEDLEIFTNGREGRTYPNGQMKYSSTYSNGCKVAFIGYYDNGVIEWKDEIKNTLKLSSTHFYPNGNIERKIYNSADYDCDISHCEMFHINGEKSREVSLKLETVLRMLNKYDSDGMKIGEVEIEVEECSIDKQVCWDISGKIIDCSNCWMCDYSDDPYPCED